MDQNISDAKFWMLQYSDINQKHKADMIKMKEDIVRKMDVAMDEMKTKVSIQDLRINFKALNDLLFVKFTQMEDCK